MIAARNNADWCAVVCRMHHVETRFDDDAWVASRRTPPLYPDAVTLSPHPSPVEILRSIDDSPGCSIKDSFASLELSQHGFRPLFDAEWIYRDPARRHDDSGLRWSVIHTAVELAEWGRAHGNGDVFHAALLEDPAVAIVVAHEGDAVAAGAVANRSEAVVGISNLFTVTAAEDQAWPGAVTAISDRFPGLPLVGYEDGPSLEAARRAGFTSVGPLRIWLKD